MMSHLLSISVQLSALHSDMENQEKFILSKLDVFMLRQEASIPSVAVGWLVGLQRNFKTFETLSRLYTGCVQYIWLKA